MTLRKIANDMSVKDIAQSEQTRERERERERERVTKSNTIKNCKQNNKPSQNNENFIKHYTTGARNGILK